MKFVCEGLDLSESLLKVSKACATRTTTPVLECIKISAYNDVLTLLASDGEISIKKEMKAEVLEEGDVCIHGKTFTDFIGKLTGESVNFVTTEKGMEISYGENSTVLQILPANEFPAVNTDIEENYFVIENKEFKDMVSRSSFCCAQDDSRPILKGCLLELKKDEFTVTALDGFRMAVLKKEGITGSGELRVVCPARTLNEIAKMVGDEGDLTVYVQSDRMMVKIEDTTIVSRLYKGEFINYRNITPVEFTSIVTVNKEELIESVERAGIVIRGDKNNLIIFEIKNGYITVTSNSEIGNVSEKVRCELIGKELRIAMNSKYISDAVKAIDSDKITVGFNTAISPFVLKPLIENGSFYLILPVRTNN